MKLHIIENLAVVTLWQNISTTFDGLHQDSLLHHRLSRRLVVEEMQGWEILSYLFCCKECIVDVTTNAVEQDRSSVESKSELVTNSLATSMLVK